MAGDKSLTLNLLAKNDQAKAKIAQIRAEYEELKAKVDEGKLDISVGQLDKQRDAQIRAVTNSLFKEAGALQQVNDTAPKTSQVLKELNAAFMDLATGGLSGGKAWGEMNLFQKAMLGINAATGLGEPVVAAGGVAFLGLASSIAAAGAGLGVFGLVAKSALSQVTPALQDFNAEQGLTGKALTAAQKKYQDYVNSLTPAQQTMAKSLIKTDSAWQTFVANNTSGVSKVLSAGMGLLPGLFKDMQLFMGPVEMELTRLIGMLGAQLNSKGFMSALHMWAASSAPAIFNILHGLGNAIKGLFGILTAFMPISDAVGSGFDGMMQKFATWGTTLSSHSGFQAFIQEGISKGPQIVTVFKNLGVVIKNFLDSSAGVTIFANSQILWNILTPLSTILAKISGNKGLMEFGIYMMAAYASTSKFSSAINSAIGLVGGVGTMVTKLATTFGILKVAEGEAAAGQEALNVAEDSNPIGAIITAIGLLVAGFAYLWTHFAGFRDFWIDAWKDIKIAFDFVWNWIKHNWPLLVGILLGPIAFAVAEIITHTHQIAHAFDVVRHDIAAVFTAIGQWILGNWKKILAWIADPVGMLVFEIRTHTHQIAVAFDTMRHDVAAILDAVRHFISNAFDLVRHTISAFADWVPHEIAHAWDMVRHATATAFDYLIHLAENLATLWVRVNLLMLDKVVGFFRGLPGRIRGTLSALPGELWQAGINIINGLIHGIESAAAAIPSLMHSIASNVVSFFTNPLGIHSPSRVFMGHGKNIVDGLIAGINGNAPMAQHAMNALARGISGTTMSASLAHSIAASNSLQVQWVGGQGDQEFMSWLKKNVRMRGGNPAVLGR